MAKQQPPATHYEFGGPLGAFACIICLPVVIYGLYFLCNDQICLQNPLEFDWKSWLDNYLPTSINQLFSWEATYIYLGWMVFQVVLERILPGETVEGAVLPNNNKLQYTISGHLQFWATLLVLFYGIPHISGAMGGSVFSINGFSGFPLEKSYDYYPQLISISVVFTFVMSVYL
jgi:hypothetical protein